MDDARRSSPTRYVLTDEPGRYYQSQGEGTHNCGPAVATMGIHLVLDLWGVGKRLTWQEVLDFMGQTWSPILPKIAGITTKYRSFLWATPPWRMGTSLGMAAAINDLAKKYGLPIQAEGKAGTLEDLKDNLRQGYPTAIVYALTNCTSAHWMLLIGYDEAADLWMFLDPDPYGLQRGWVTGWTTQQLLENWGRPFHGKFAGITWATFAKAMVTIRPRGPGPGSGGEVGG